MHEIYPMPLFVRLHVSDVARSAAWYAGALGLESVFALSDGSGGQVLNHLRGDRYQDLLLVARASDAQVAGAPDFSIGLAYAGDLDELAARARAHGGNVSGPSGTRWNTTEMVATDPDGFLVAFSKVRDSTRSFADVMSRDSRS